MYQLIFVSLLWAFSFGLIKGELTGLPSAAVAMMRLGVACLVFLPFLRIRTLQWREAGQLLLIGAVQYGLMYVAYIHSYSYLQAHEVALFTVFTPIYITLINDWFERTISWRTLFAVLLAVAGGIWIELKQLGSPELLKGFLLLQGANLCFAFGQIAYRRTMSSLQTPRNNVQVFGLIYFGATLCAALATIGTDWAHIEITARQGIILLYLGSIASGLGFFIWNRAARQVDTGALAIANNLKIPLGIVVSILVFREAADWIRLAGGGILMGAALWANARKPNNTLTQK